MFMLPEFIFFTGIPGSRWSGIAQDMKVELGLNLTDRADHRIYKHGDFSGHMDAYYGTGMEFNTSLDEDNLNAPFTDKSGSKLLMSHEWPYHFDEIMARYPDAWITLVYRHQWESFLWWKKAGGFDITYPNYDWYESDYHMQQIAKTQNRLILGFAQGHNLQWKQHKVHNDIFITTYKP